MDRVRRRIKDKRILGLVKAFLKAGILTELAKHERVLALDIDVRRRLGWITMTSGHRCQIG